MDETQIHHFTPESNQQSGEWTTAGESHPKQPKMQTSAGKVLTFVFFNSEYYVALSVHLKEEIT